MIDLRIFLWLASLVFLGPISSLSPKDVDWCEIEKYHCKNAHHVACLDPKTDDNFFPSVKLIDSTEEFKQKLLKQINDNRNELAAGTFPGIPYQASRMMKVDWSETMEYLSRAELQRRNSSNYCRISSNGALDDTVETFSAKLPNLFISNKNQLDSFFDYFISLIFYSVFARTKIQKYNLVDIKANTVELYKLFENNTVNGASFTDQYLYGIGCAFSILPSFEDSPNRTDNDQELNSKFLCTLQHRFNYNYTYKIGPPCSECNLLKMRCSKYYPNLCEKYDEESEKVDIHSKIGSGSLANKTFGVLIILLSGFVIHHGIN
ncbi:uncharacterized protein LOC129808258 [Phlebotomus papatasi]|uniref:uncharacterized protein LOC129808258 n=1 Tax=Phlebotomus papatasi TaxID=29031 RepID=UPI0024843E61|nr:uncharacterized protein LOC129808258 [Phlebotomus papatasi]